MGICCRLCAGWFCVPVLDDDEEKELEEKTPLEVQEVEIVMFENKHKSQYNLIVNLPKYMFLSISKEWLTLKELATLDTSLSDKKQRTIFLNFISSPDVIFYAHRPINETISKQRLPFSYVFWLLARQVNVAELDFGDSFQKLNSSFQIHEQKLIKVKILRLGDVNIFSLDQVNILMSICPDLEKLYLYISMLNRTDHSPIPSTFFDQCANLTFLDLRQMDTNHSNGTLCAILKRCSRLGTLIYTCSKMGWQGATTPDFAELTVQHTSLTSLDLSNSHMVTDEVMLSVLTHCVCLQFLNLNECIRLSDVTLQTIAHHSALLTTLSVRNLTTITDQGVASIASGCTALTSLDLSECSLLTDASLLSISQHTTRLIQFYVNHMRRISDVGIESIAKTCLSLEVVHITTPYSRQTGGVTSAVLRKFTHCVQLSELQFNLGTRLPIEVGVVTLTKHCQRLKSVDISRNEVTSDAVVSAFGLHCPLLEGLSVYGERLTDKSVVTLAEGCPKLTLLHIREAVLLTDLSVMSLSRHCAQLTELKLDGCQRLTDSSLISLGKHCKDLRVLSVGGCFELTDIGVSSLVVNCTLLCELNVQYANKLTANCVRMLKARKGLRSLKVPLKQ